MILERHNLKNLALIIGYLKTMTVYKLTVAYSLSDRFASCIYRGRSSSRKVGEFNPLRILYKVVAFANVKKEAWHFLRTQFGRPSSKKELRCGKPGDRLLKKKPLPSEESQRLRGCVQL